LEHDRQVESLAQLLGEPHALEARYVLGEANDAVRALDDAGHTGQHAVDQSPLETRGLDQPGAQLLDRLERGRRAAVDELDVLPGPHPAAEIADRPAQEARAEVEAEHERRLEDRLEVDRPVARSRWAVLGLADQTGAD